MAYADPRAQAEYATRWRTANHRRYLARRRAWWARNRTVIKVSRVLGVPVTQARLLLDEKRRH